MNITLCWYVYMLNLLYFLLATTEITSRSDEVARCQSLLQATAVEIPVPAFLSHSFEEVISLFPCIVDLLFV